MERPEIDRLFAGLTRKQKLLLAKRDAREIAYVLNDSQGHRKYNTEATNVLFEMCDRYARKAGKS